MSIYDVGIISCERDVEDKNKVEKDEKKFILCVAIA